MADKLSDSTDAAIKKGIWLARHNGARLVFFNALEVPDYARFVAEEQVDIRATLIADSEGRLAAIAQRAKAESVDADYVLTFAKSWVEIIRQVLKQRHDLVIAGTHQRGTAASVLFGSTGMKLLRKCPCPVWITKPREHHEIGSVLVANDLSPISDLALELGVSIADLQRGPASCVTCVGAWAGKTRMGFVQD